MLDDRGHDLASDAGGSCVFTTAQPRVCRVFSEGLPRLHVDGIEPGGKAETTRIGDIRQRVTTEYPVRQRVRESDEVSAANLTSIVDTELELVEQWRHEALARAGYDSESATVLAASHDVDLHQAVDLLQRGCSIELALQILL